MIEQEYLQRIHELEKQIARLQTEIKKNSETQYGLRWMDVPEAFEAEAENAIPTLEEVKEKAITNDDGKPTHILIEGDNFHALTCLNYTHKGQIDVIYIDPPYNTGEGEDIFYYKDKRILDKFPDGAPVPKDHPLRHSYWLSFMEKRLRLAKNLLSEQGVIYISIDDREAANLRLLCDAIFGETCFIESFVWQKIFRPSNMPKTIRKNAEYVLFYASNPNSLDLVETSQDPQGDASLTQNNNAVRPLLFPAGYVKILLPDGIYPKGQYGKIEVLDDIIVKDRTSTNAFSISGKFKWSQEYLDEEISKGVTLSIKSKGLIPYYRKDYQMTALRPTKLIPRELVGDVLQSGAELEQIFERPVFKYPKPTSLLKHLISLLQYKNDITILDFFAGSGTTMHATMQLNEEDGGHRQCILVQQNENNICENVTYERNKRVIQGYTNSKKEHVPGLGNSLKYYRTAFVGEHDIQHINDADKVALTQKAGCLLALGENTLEEIKTEKAFQIFQLRKGDKPANDFGYTAIYFSGNLMYFADFRREIERIQQEQPLARIAMYVFTWGDPSIFENEFDDLSGITIKPIPQPILEIYQNINQLQ